jgi:hypothetical protein
VSADQIASIQPGVVHLAISTQESGQLPEYQVPESAEILPEKASLKARIETDIEKHSGGHRTY